MKLNIIFYFFNILSEIKKENKIKWTYYMIFYIQNLTIKTISLLDYA